LKFQLKERPTLGLALVLDVDGDTIRRLLPSSAASAPCRHSRIKPTRFLTGMRSQVEKQLTDAAEALAQAADPVDDLEGSADYKRHLIGCFCVAPLPKRSPSVPSRDLPNAGFSSARANAFAICVEIAFCPWLARPLERADFSSGASVQRCRVL